MLAVVACHAGATSPASWVMLLSLAPLDSAHHWRVWMELQPRIEWESRSVYQFVLRPGLGYQPTPSLSVWAGYAWIATYQPREVFEHRAWQQLTWTLPAGSLRLRTEERFFQTGGQFRLRGMVRSVIPTGMLHLILSDEVFIIPAAWHQAVVAGYDQNRLFIGAQIPLGQSVRAEVGYQNMHYRGNSTRHVVVVSFVHQP